MEALQTLHSEMGRLLLAFALGTLIGLEREISDKPAGLRTNVLICLGSALFTMLSKAWPGAGGVSDAHIAAQIVTGIGFLGAGAILREGEHVVGLTTAATIWVVAAIGMAVGLGHFALAGVATAATLIVQVLLARMDELIDRMRRRYVFRVVSSPDDGAIHAIERILRSNGVVVMHQKVMKRGKLYHSEWDTTGPTDRQAAVAHQLLQSDRVMEVTY